MSKSYEIEQSYDCLPITHHSSLLFVTDLRAVGGMNA